MEKRKQRRRHEDGEGRERAQIKREKEKYKCDLYFPSFNYFDIKFSIRLPTFFPWALFSFILPTVLKYRLAIIVGCFGFPSFFCFPSLWRAFSFFLHRIFALLSNKIARVLSVLVYNFEQIAFRFIEYKRRLLRAWVSWVIRNLLKKWTLRMYNFSEHIVVNFLMYNLSSIFYYT